MTENKKIQVFIHSKQGCIWHDEFLSYDKLEKPHTKNKVDRNIKVLNCIWSQMKLQKNLI
jgi:hypothetical protein